MGTWTPIIQQNATALNITLDDETRIAFALDGDRLFGIRDVQRHGTPLRNPSKLWRPVIYTPEGIHYSEFRLTTARPLTDGGVAVETDAIGIHTLRKEEEDEYLCDVLDLVADDGPVVDRLTWELHPSDLELGGRTFTGFSYVYRFESADPSRKIYRIFDSATWEIGGHVEGNTLLLQGQTNPPVTRLSRDGYFTTACNYYGSEMGAVMGPPDRVSMQRLSRVATIQSFDFLHHTEGVLFNYFDPTIEVVSIVQKGIGEDVLHVVDELRKPLADTFESFPKHILFLPTDEALTKEDTRNLWREALDFTHDRERARVGIMRSPVLPRVWMPQVGSDEYAFGDARGPRNRALYYMADHVLPRWAEMGVREICAPSYWVSDYTVDRFRCKDETGLQGGFTVSGICCVRSHEIDPLFGGPEAVAYLTEAAHRLGMTVQLWWATHLSRRAPIFAERPEFMIRSRDNQPGCGGIGHQVIIPMDLNNPECLEWEFNKLKAVYEATGVDGFFHDSYGNYTFLPINYGDDQRRAQQEAYGRLVARLQGIGLKTFTVEGLGPWGVGHFGMQLLPQKSGEKGSYQYLLEWWLGEEDMLYGLNMGIHQAVWEGREQEAERFAFRCLAYGGRFGFTGRENGVEMWNGWVRKQGRLHAAVAPLQGRRTLLPADAGVQWDMPDGDQLIFAFQSMALPVSEGHTVHHVTPDGDETLDSSAGPVQAEAWQAYRVRG